MEYIGKLKIRTRLYVLMLLALIAIASISLYSLNATKKVGELVNTINQHPLTVSNLAADSQHLLLNIYKTYQEAYSQQDPSKKRAYETKIDDYNSELITYLDTIKILILGEEGQQLADEVLISYQNWVQNNSSLLDNIYSVDNQDVARLYMTNSLVVYIDDFQNQLESIQSYAKNKAVFFNNQAKEIEKKAEKDIVIFSVVLILLLFGITLLIIRNISFSLERIKSTMSESMSKNKFIQADIIGNDEIADVSINYNVLIGKLEEQYNFRLRLNELSLDISGNLSLKALSNAALTKLVSFTHSVNGVFYAFDTDQQILELVATYAYNAHQKSSDTFNLGESLIGQVAIDRKLVLINDIKPGDGLITTGTTRELPKSIVVIPLVFEDQLCGVIELSSFDRIDEKELVFLGAAAEMIAVNLYATVQREKIRMLLEQSQKQAENLQLQQEELRQSNEELEEQSKALKESESMLQLQQEELRITNEELEIHAKQLEANHMALKEKNLTLENIQKELLSKAEVLEKTNKYKTEFLANMSHELRTPLNSILVLSQLLMDKDEMTPLTKKEKEFASTIYSSGKDLLDLINGVLDLSKVEAGKIDIHKEKVYLKEVINENRNLFESIADMKNIDLRFSIDQDLPEYLESDKFRVNQIIKNLLSNAIKFTHDGHVEVKFRKLDETEVSKLNIPVQDYIVIDVKDTGIGIPAAKMHEIFEAFMQSDGTTSRQYGGTGLGLTISLELANLLGGKIIHESVENIGSTFSLVLPLILDEYLPQLDVFGTLEMMENYDHIDASEDLEIVKPVEQTEKHILIIEDDPVFAQLLSDLTTEKGYAATVAYNGKEGIKKAKKLNPTGIILDIGLPDMDGMILANMLSENPITKHIPIHVISGSEEINELGDMIKMPKSIIGFLKKPVDIKSIYKTLSKLESINLLEAKQILVVGECGNDDFSKFTLLGQFKIKKVMTGKEAFEEIESETYSCIILDIKLSDISGVEFMHHLREELMINTPIIIYTEEEIDTDELDNVNKYTETIIMKSKRSLDRLVDEVSLFLFDINKNISMRSYAKDTKVTKSHALSELTILLADDDNRNIFALMHLLESNDMKVIVAKDGIEAVEKFKQNDIDLILMDVMMPRMDGYEAMKKIRETQKGQKIPIIALTAKAMADDRDKCISAGANDYLTKPVDTKKILSMIEVWKS